MSYGRESVNLRIFGISFADDDDVGRFDILAFGSFILWNTRKFELFHIFIQFNLRSH